MRVWSNWMHSTGLRPLVAQLLQRHGYTVHTDETLEGRSGSVYTVPMLAEGDRALLIEFKDSPDPVETADVEYLGRLVDDAGAEHAILIHAGPAPHIPFPRQDVTLWGPQRIRTLLGDGAVHEATGTPLSPLPLGPGAMDPAVAATPTPEPPAMLEAEPLGIEEDLGFSDLLPSAFQEPAAITEEPAFAGLDLDALESIDTPIPSAPTAPPPSLGPSALTPKVPIVEARAMVKDRITRIETETLVLHPMHIVDYECDLMVDGSLKQDTVAGRVQVRGDKSGSMEVDRNHVDVTAIGTLSWEGPIDERPFRRDAERAMQEAKLVIMDSHTKMVDVQAEDEASDYAMVERKKVAPDGDQIRMDHRAATYRPAWRFDGPNGTVTIDALTGETLDESLVTRSGDTIILD